ncbi:hypothetical protein [Streptomyces adustus]
MNRVVPVGTVLEGARVLVAEMLVASPTSFRASFQVMAETEGIPDALDALDAIDGMAAFARKRRPRWSNR